MSDKLDTEGLDTDKMTDELIKELKLQLEAEKEQKEIALVAAGKDKSRVDELNNFLSKLQADFDNFRKRAAETQKKSEEDGIAKVIERMLPVIDVLRQAMLMVGDQKVIDGLKMVTRQMTDVFDSFGLTEIPALGEKFDPTLHNAVMQDAAKSPDEVDTVVEVFQKGFRIGERIIRHSVVKVAK